MAVLLSLAIKMGKNPVSLDEIKGSSVSVPVYHQHRQASAAWSTYGAKFWPERRQGTHCDGKDADFANQWRNLEGIGVEIQRENGEERSQGGANSIEAVAGREGNPSGSRHGGGKSGRTFLQNIIRYRGFYVNYWIAIINRDPI
jgi:hypothetical protein